jgi:hypothetical protein
MKISAALWSAAAWGRVELIAMSLLSRMKTPGVLFPSFDLRFRAILLKPSA